MLGSENSQNLPLCKHALLSTWITILITLSLLLLLCRFKVHYFKFKFNPSKLARWLYTIVRCHMDEGWSKSDTGKVPNGHFLLFPIIHSWQTLQVWRQKRQLLIFQQKRQLTIINGEPICGVDSIDHGLTRGVTSHYSLTYLSIYLSIFTNFRC